MKTTETTQQMIDPEFFKMKKHKGLRAFMVGRRNQQPYMRLCLDIKIPFSDKTEYVSKDFPVKLSVRDYEKGYSFGGRNNETDDLSFYQSVYNGYESHIATFLSDIKPTSEIKFEAIRGSGSENSHNLGITQSSLYGYIGERKYFLFFTIEYHGKTIMS